MTKLREQLIEKEKEVKLTALKLKEFYQSQKNSMTDSQYIEVDRLMKEPTNEWAQNYHKFRELSDRMMRRQQNNNLVSNILNRLIYVLVDYGGRKDRRQETSQTEGYRRKSDER